MSYIQIPRDIAKTLFARNITVFIVKQGSKRKVKASLDNIYKETYIYFQKSKSVSNVKFVQMYNLEYWSENSLIETLEKNKPKGICEWRKQCMIDQGNHRNGRLEINKTK